MKKNLVLFILFFWAGAINAQTRMTTLEDLRKAYPDSSDGQKTLKRMQSPSGLEEKYDVKELREDFLQFRGYIENVHPCPYEFTSEESFDASFRKQYGKIAVPISLREFYCLLAPLKGKIGDGHAHLDYPAEYRSTVQNRKFPLILSFLPSGCYVRRDLHEDAFLPSFSRILSINGTAVEDIEETLRTEIGADGHNRFFKTSALDNCFQYYYANHYGAPEEYRISYMSREGGDAREVVIPAIPCAGINYSNHVPRELQIRLFPGKNTAVLTIDSFSYYGDRNKIFFDFVDESFTCIKEEKIENVVIDLRGNGGGDPFCASYLWAYIERESQPYFSKPYGKYAALSQPIERAGAPFDGALFILTDGSGFSTTGHFCALVRYHDRATFVGTETGGTYTCNAAVKVFTLKNTGLGLKLATGSYAAAVEGFPKDRGIIPDHSVAPTVQDLRQGKDPVMDHVFMLIKSADRTDAAAEFPA